MKRMKYSKESVKLVRCQYCGSEKPIDEMISDNGSIRLSHFCNKVCKLAFYNIKKRSFIDAI